MPENTQFRLFSLVTGEKLSWYFGNIPYAQGPARTGDVLFNKSQRGFKGRRQNHILCREKK